MNDVTLLETDMAKFTPTLQTHLISSTGSVKTSKESSLKCTVSAVTVFIHDSMQNFLTD
jgi:hypothetical protein